MGTTDVSLDLKINPKHVDGKFEGYFYVKTNGDIKINEIEIKVFVEIKGKNLNEERDVLVKADRKADLQISANTPEKVPFFFVIANDLESYKGRIFDVNYRCQLTVWLDYKSYSSLNKSLFKEIHSVVAITQDHSIQKKVFFKYKIPNKGIQVAERKYDLTYENDLSFRLILAVFGISIILFCVFGFDVIHAFVAFLGGVILVSLVTNTGLKYYRGKTNVAISADATGFDALFDSAKSFNFNDAEVFYEMIECENYSENKVEEVLYRSASCFLTNENRKASFDFYSPLNQETILLNSFSLIYRLSLTQKGAFGKEYLYTVDFKVNKLKN